MRTLLVGAALAFSLLASQSAAEIRTWKDRTGGFSVEAEFVSLVDGKVTLKRANGKLAVVPLDKLSDADQQVVKREAASASADSKSASEAPAAAAGPTTVGDTAIEVAGLQIVRPRPPSRGSQGKGGFSMMAGPMGSDGTTLHLSLANSKQNIIGMDEKKSQVVALLDDKKTDLLKAAKGDDDKFGGSMFGPLQAHIAPDGHQCTIEIKAPATPARGATKIQLDATVVLLCGADEKTAEQKDLTLKKGSKVTAGPVPMTVGRVEEAKFGDAKLTVTLTSKTSLKAIKEIAFLNGDGSPIKHEPMGHGQFGFNNDITYEASYGLPEKVDSVTIKVTYFGKVDELQLPLKVDVGLGL